MYAKGTGRCVIIHIEFYSGELIMIRKEQLRLYAITDTSWLNGASLIDVVENVLKNGATFLQLREKNASHDEIVAKAKAIKPIEYHLLLMMMCRRHLKLTLTEYISDRVTLTI